MENKNSHKVFVTLGASNHSELEREEFDYYATEPKAMELLLNEEKFSESVWECAVGGGHLADVLKENGYKVICSDIVDRGYPNTEIKNFLDCSLTNVDADIITNPPYSLATEFVEKAMEVVGEGHKVAMFLRLAFLEGKKRKELFKKYPPKYVYVASGRLQCARNGEFDKYKKGSGTALAHAWFVWEKGFKGETIVRWIN